MFSNKIYDNDEDFGAPIQIQLAICGEALQSLPYKMLSKASHPRNLKDITPYTSSNVIFLY